MTSVNVATIALFAGDTLSPNLTPNRATPNRLRLGSSSHDLPGDMALSEPYSVFMLTLYSKSLSFQLTHQSHSPPQFDTLPEVSPNGPQMLTLIRRDVMMTKYLPDRYRPRRQRRRIRRRAPRRTRAAGSLSTRG